MVLLVATTASAQVSVEEAQHRLAEKMATRPATTQPSTEVEKLRAENLKLRERVMALEEEVAVLKGSLARASTELRAAATQPNAAPDQTAREKPLVGRWRGGDITAGTGYLLEFSTDGTYKQLFTTTGQRVNGEFRVLEDNTLEMWNSKWPEGKRHNQYRLATTALEATLTPTVLDNTDLKNAKPLVLKKVE
jgi:hypothetical protein